LGDLDRRGRFTIIKSVYFTKYITFYQPIDFTVYLT
jgi:hypothetical protein